ncbi:MAG: nucleoside diphosphate kinase regulator [Pirellulales bacterium]
MIMKPIVITKQDQQRLSELIDSSRARPNGHGTNIDLLEREVSRSRIVDRHSLPEDVVTMNSKVRVRDLDSQESEEYTLVYPTHANPEANRLSVLAPIGTALIGSQAGDIIEWPVPAGSRRLLVEEIVYQPEKAGAADL